MDLMNAEQMFEELGYRRITDIDAIAYSERLDGTFYRFEITFDLLEKEITIDTNMKNVIESDLLQAIIQQVKELHWLDEKTEIKEARNPDVTNLEYYKDEILDNCLENLAVVKGIPKPCSKTDCNDCDFLTIQKDCHEIAKEWLKHPYKKTTYKLTKFEIDLLQSCSQGYSPKYQFKNINSLTEMRKNGYFKCINRDETIEEILAKSEVVG